MLTNLRKSFLKIVLAVLMITTVMTSWITLRREGVDRRTIPGVALAPGVTAHSERGQVTKYQGDRLILFVEYRAFSVYASGATSFDGVTLSVADWVEIVAGRASLDPMREELVLSDGLSISTESGLSITVPEATYAVGEGHLVVRRAFELTTYAAVVNGESLHYGSERPLHWVVTKPRGLATVRLVRPASGLNDFVVSADTLDYDEANRRSAYVGRAGLSRDDAIIQADRIESDENGDLSASGHVYVQLHRRSQSAPQGDVTERLVGRAEAFQYSDLYRRAIFIRKANLEGEHGDLRADRIELTFAGNSNALRQLQADGAVSVQVDAMSATGIHLTYQPTTQEYVIVGSPASLVEKCKETNGPTVTFGKRSDGC